MGQDKEGDFDELGQLLLNDNVDNPGGHCLVEENALGLAPRITRQQPLKNIVLLLG